MTREELDKYEKTSYKALEAVAKGTVPADLAGVRIAAAQRMLEAISAERYRSKYA